MGIRVAVHFCSMSHLCSWSTGPWCRASTVVLGSVPVASTLGLSLSLACCGFHLLISKTKNGLRHHRVLIIADADTGVAIQGHSSLYVLGLGESLASTASCSAKMECDLDAGVLVRGLLSSYPTIQSYPCLLFLSVLLHGPCLPFFGQWQRPGAERFLCGDTLSVQARGLSSAGGCSQPGWALIHSARDGLHSLLVEAWPSRRAGPVPGGRWPGGALRADSPPWASPGTEALSTYVVALPK